MSFYDKRKLVQMGMYSSCRCDTYFCVGKLLDGWKEKGEISDEQFLKVKREWEKLNPDDPHDFVERWLKKINPNNKHGIYGIYSIRPDKNGKTETSLKSIEKVQIVEIPMFIGR